MSLLLLLRPPRVVSTGTINLPPTGSNVVGLRILGAATVGATLTIDTAGIPAGSYTYQWLRANPVPAGQTPSWTSIPGANSVTYTLTSADNGKLISAILS